jgi:lipopolysaccharide transport system permease protein
MSLKNDFELSFILAKIGFVLRNEGTWLGIFWYILAPILTFLLLFVIFFDRLGKQIPDYAVYLFLGIILFNFFQKITSESIAIIRFNSGIIKSMNFSRESLVGSVILKALFSHVFEIVLLSLFLIYFKIPLIGLIFYPLILILLLIFSFGISLILSSLGIYFFDLGNVWEFASKLIWFGTPIFYSIRGQTTLFHINLFNPMYYFITITREILIYNALPELWMIGITLFYSLTSLLIGLFVFNKLKIKFAELI